MNARLMIVDELPPLPTVEEIHVESALGTIKHFREYLIAEETKGLLNYEYKAAETLPVFESILQRLLAWKGDMLKLPNADDLIKALVDYISQLELIMSVKKEYAECLPQ